MLDFGTKARIKAKCKNWKYGKVWLLSERLVGDECC